jgi:hypothetical protein
MSDVISSFLWISPTYNYIEKLKIAYSVINYINDEKNAKNNENKYKFILSTKYIYLTDAILFFINSCESSPLKRIFNDTADVFIPANKQYNLSKENNDIGIMISLIIISAGELDAFSFLNPDFLPYVYKFIVIYMGDYEKHFSYIINRLINSVLSTDRNMILESAKILLCMNNYISESTYPHIKNAIGYIIYRFPMLSKNSINVSSIKIYDFNLICHENVKWLDVYITILAIIHAPINEIELIEKNRNH